MLRFAFIALLAAALPLAAQLEIEDPGASRGVQESESAAKVIDLLLLRDGSSLTGSAQSITQDGRLNLRHSLTRANICVNSAGISTLNFGHQVHPLATTMLLQTTTGEILPIQSLSCNADKLNLMVFGHATPVAIPFDSFASLSSPTLKSAYSLHIPVTPTQIDLDWTLTNPQAWSTNGRLLRAMTPRSPICSKASLPERFQLKAKLHLPEHGRVIIGIHSKDKSTRTFAVYIVQGQMRLHYATNNSSMSTSTSFQMAPIVPLHIQFDNTKRIFKVKVGESELNLDGGFEPLATLGLLNFTAEQSGFAISELSIDPWRDQAAPAAAQPVNAAPQPGQIKVLLADNADEVCGILQSISPEGLVLSVNGQLLTLALNKIGQILPAAALKPAATSSPCADVLHFGNGSALNGTVNSLNNEEIVFTHALLGQLRLPRANISSISFNAPAKEVSP